RALLDPEVVVVGGVDDRLLRERGVAPVQPADDVARLLLLDRVLERDVHGHAQADGPEVALLRGGAERVEVLAAEGRDLARAVLGDPSLDLDLGLALLGEAELLARPRRLDDLPGIARGRRRVDDESPCSAGLRRRGVLVVPAPVVEPGLSREELGIVL